ncbi:MAG: CHASE2 domain-containing protein, partial [Alkalinema sp. RU_4_3]|nr:CHASE2 domain-containing protein [Alkalinema sp. RU_4_3]
MNIQRKIQRAIARIHPNVDRHLWHWRGPWLVAPMVAAVVWGGRSLGALQGLEWACFDQGMRWRLDEGRDRRVLIVEVTEKDLQRAQQWPLSGQVLAELINRIKQGQPAAIGLDIYRDFPVEPGHQALNEVFRTTPNLIGIQKLIANDGGSAILPPSELADRDQVGSNDLLLDLDGRLRRSLLYQSVGETTHESFSLRLADLYLAHQGIEPDLEAPVLTWRGRSFPPFERNDGGYVGADASAHQMLLNYRSGAQPFERVSMGAVLAGQVPKAAFRNRVVMIGTTAASLKDRFLTPLSQSRKGVSVLMPGIEVHAHGVSQILGDGAGWAIATARLVGGLGVGLGWWLGRGLGAGADLGAGGEAIWAGWVAGCW